MTSAFQDLKVAAEASRVAAESLDDKAPALSGGRIPVVLPAGFSTETTLGSVLAALGGVLVVGDGGGSLTVDAAALPLPAGAATETTLAAVLAASPMIAADTIPDEFSESVPVRSLPQRQHRLGFSKVIAANAVDTSLLSIIGTRGPGIGVSQAGGNLSITTGTTANQDLILRGLETYTGGVRLSCSSSISQRIVNQSFFVELVDVLGDALAATITNATTMTVTLPAVPDAMSVGQGFTVGGYSGTGVLPSQRAVISAIAGNVVTLTIAGASAGSGTVSAFGWNYYQVLYNGTTPTAAIYNNQRNGWKDTDTTLTINTTASPGHAIIVSGNDARARVSDQVLTSATSPNITDRASRAVNVPDDVPLYLQVRVVNGTTNPASTTTWAINAITVGNFAGQDVVIQDHRQGSAMHKLDVALAAGANIIGAVTGSGSFTVDSELPAAAAVADALANPTAPQIAADGMLFNGVTWDRARNNANGTTGDTGAKTATFNGAAQTNYNARGALITCLFGAVTGTSPTIAMQLQFSPDGGTTWLNYGPAIAAFTPALNNTATLLVYPAIIGDDTTATLAALAIGATQAKAMSAPLPRTWRLLYTIGGTTPSITITAVYVNHLA